MLTLKELTYLTKNLRYYLLMEKNNFVKRTLMKNGKPFTEEEVEKINTLFEYWAKLDFNNYLKIKKHEKHSNL